MVFFLCEKTEEKVDKRVNGHNPSYFFASFDVDSRPRENPD